MDILSINFAALAATQKLHRGSKHYRQAQAHFIVTEFNNYFGEETQLANWQKLCRDLGVPGGEEGLGSVSLCRKALKPIWVNIWDLLSAVQGGHAVTVFRSESELAAYTRRTGKFYPRDFAKRFGPVRALLARVA